MAYEQHHTNYLLGAGTGRKGWSATATKSFGVLNEQSLPTITDAPPVPSLFVKKWIKQTSFVSLEKPSKSDRSASALNGSWSPKPSITNWMLQIQMIFCSICTWVLRTAQLEPSSLGYASPGPKVQISICFLWSAWWHNVEILRQWQVLIKLGIPFSSRPISVIMIGNVYGKQRLKTSASSSCGLFCKTSYGLLAAFSRTVATLMQCAPCAAPHQRHQHIWWPLASSLCRFRTHSPLWASLCSSYHQTTTEVSSDGGHPWSMWLEHRPHGNMSRLSSTSPGTFGRSDVVGCLTTRQWLRHN